MERSRWQARKEGREDLKRAILKQAQREGNYKMTEREARRKADARADKIDKTRTTD